MMSVEKRRYWESSKTVERKKDRHGKTPNRRYDYLAHAMRAGAEKEERKVEKRGNEGGKTNKKKKKKIQRERERGKNDEFAGNKKKRNCRLRSNEIVTVQ